MSFLIPVLRLHMDKRAKASELHHNWLNGVIMQGEVDVIRWAEEEAQKGEAAVTGRDEERDEVSGAGPGGRMTHRRRISVLSQSEVDAMKPVDDIPMLADADVGPPEHARSSHGHHPPILSVAPVPSSAIVKENAARPLSATGPPPGVRLSSGPAINVAPSSGKCRG